VIDIHTHPVQVAELLERDPDLPRAVRDVFGLFMPPQPLRTYELHLDEAGTDQAVVLPIDCTTAHGAKVVSNEGVAWLMEQTDRVIGFASVDPSEADAPAKLEHAVKEYGLVGLKLDPALQLFDPADRDRAFPVYEQALALDIPVLIHCGLSWARVGRSSKAHPLALEDVVHAFPELKIVIPHSGTPPESMRHTLERVGLDLLDRSLHAQLLFGSNYPRVDPKRVADGVRKLGLRKSLERKIFDTNAKELLKMNAQVAA
jgi:uncharacterized protein